MFDVNFWQGFVGTVLLTVVAMASFLLVVCLGTGRGGTAVLVFLLAAALLCGFLYTVVLPW